MDWDQMRALMRADLAIADHSVLERTSLRIVRLGQWAHDKPAPVRVLWRLLDVVYLRLLIGAEIPPTVRIGPGLTLLHAGRSVTMHARVTIGSGAVILHGVTIGFRGGDPHLPRLGDNVFVGNGASILGGVHIADGARIGAHAVVLDDVGERETAVGVPAVVRRRANERGPRRRLRDGQGACDQPAAPGAQVELDA